MGWMTIVADYTCQALISSLLFSHFPTDSIVGEEDSSELNTPENVATKAAIVRLSNEAMSESLEGEEEAAWAGVKADTRGEKEWLAIIDRGNSEGGKHGRESPSPVLPLLAPADGSTDVKDTGRLTLSTVRRDSSEGDNTPSASDFWSKDLSLWESWDAPTSLLTSPSQMVRRVSSSSPSRARELFRSVPSPSSRFSHSPSYLSSDP